MSATIYDVAERSGVSTATVSRIISGKITSRSKSYQRVMEAIQELGYTSPALRAAHLAEEPQVPKVMLIVDDLTNPFYQGIIGGISSVLAEKGYLPQVVVSGTGAFSEESLLRIAQAERCAGAIMLTAIETPGLIEVLSRLSIPVVMVNRSLRSYDVNSICIDNRRGGYIATQYLIRNGHRRIAHLSGPVNSTASYDRMCGFRDAMDDNHLPVPKESVFPGDLKPASGAAFADYFLRQLKGYTAVFCANDLMAATFVKALRDHGVTVPKDVSVICFDDTPETTAGIINLTTVAQNPATMGRAAAENLLGILGGHSNLCQKAIFPPTLIERESVAPLN